MMNKGTPVDEALTKMGVQNAEIRDDIKDKLSFHAINSGAHVPKGTPSKLNIDINGKPVQTDGSGNVKIDINGRPANRGSNLNIDFTPGNGNEKKDGTTDIDITIPTPKEAVQEAAAKVGNAIANPVGAAAKVADGAAKALNNFFFGR